MEPNFELTAEKRDVDKWSYEKIVSVFSAKEITISAPGTKRLCKSHVHLFMKILILERKENVD